MVTEGYFRQMVGGDLVGREGENNHCNLQCYMTSDCFVKITLCYNVCPRRADGHMNGGVTDEVVPVEGEGNKRRPPFFPSHPIYIFSHPTNARRADE